jgi:hypothetical protein
MLAYTLKEILTLLPEALPLVKEAHIDQEMPLGNRDSAIATALQLKYHEAVNYRPADIFSIEKVAKAVRLYGAEDVVDDLSKKLVKAAAERRIQLGRDYKDEYLQKEAAFHVESTGYSDPLRVVGQAEQLYKEAKTIGIEPSEEVVRYSGNGYLNKEAAIRSLAARYQATQNADFVKIASAINKLDTFTMKPETVQDICRTISEMDKQAGISAKGFNFYREAILTKEAELGSVMHINLCGKAMPFEKIARVGRDRISQYIGEDVAKEMDQSPLHTKHAFEALPLDLQRVIVDLTKNV